MKTKVNLSLEPDTASTLKTLARESHKTVSQWVTDKVWESKATERRPLPLCESGLRRDLYKAFQRAGYEYLDELKGLRREDLMRHVTGLDEEAADEVLERLKTFS